MSLHRNDSPTRPKRRGLYALAGVLALAACASGGAGGNWMRAGASAEDIKRDYAECQLAGQAASLSLQSRSQSTYVGVSATGTATTQTMPGAQSLQFLDQQQGFKRCMMGRGYKRGSAAAG